MATANAPQKPKILTSVDTVIDTLGGNLAVAKLFNTAPSAVSNWRGTGRFPARTYVLIQTELDKKNLLGSDGLWAMYVK
jgi:hypothetical protein